MSAPEKAKNQVTASEDSKATISHFRDRVERLQDEISRLKVLDSLLTSSTNREISELAWLTSPIASNLEAIQSELMDFFYTTGLEITTKAKTDKPAKLEAVNG
jgi:hypothetical protein